MYGRLWFEIFRLGTSLWVFTLIDFAGDLALGNYCLGSVEWEIRLGILPLGTVAWRSSVELSLVNFALFVGFFAGKGPLGVFRVHVCV